MQKLLPLVLALSLICLGAKPPCPKGINLLPKYGRAKKCPEQLAADREFIAQVEQQQGSRQKGAAIFIELGWQYLAREQVNTAMNRFNQAWMLDSLNEQIEWGFGSALGMHGKNKESLPFFRIATKQNAANKNVWHDAAVSYGNVYSETKRVVYLDTAIIYLRKSIRLDNAYVPAYAELAKVYHFYPQADSAKKYLAIADKLNPVQVDWKIRAMITDK